MKKRFLLGLIVGIFAGIGICFVLYYLTVGQMEWETFMNEQLIPTALIVITAVGTVCTAALPVVGRVQLAIEKFNKATSDVNDATSTNNKVKADVIGYGDQIAALRNEIASEMASIQSDVRYVKDVCRIGFCNQSELVEKNVAKRIEDMGTGTGTGDAAHEEV